MRSFGNATERLIELFLDCHDDPDLFNSAWLNRPAYYNRQVEMCRSVVDYRCTVVYSGNSIGKDYWIGGLVPWWLYTRPNSLIIVTGPTQTVLGSVTWKEIRRAIEGSFLPVKPRITGGIKASPAMVEIKPGWHALGYSTTSVERASGQHARDLLVIVEEASGVEDEIWDALESLKYTKLVAIGNPIRAEGRFIEMIRPADADRADGIPKHKATNAIRVPSTDSPDANKEHSEYGLADATWIEATRRRFGPNSLYCGCHIDAIIPEISSQLLFPREWLDDATLVQRPNLPPNHPIHRTRRIAIDLGEGVGRDETCIYVRDSLGSLDCHPGNFVSLVDAAQETARLSRQWAIPCERISYDGLGIGRDFHNHLARVGLRDCIRYIGGGRPREPSRFANLRTEAAWHAHDALNPDRHTNDEFPTSSRQSPFHIPARDWWPMMREDLEAITYELINDRRVRLIKKEDLMVRLGRSPDRGDAFCQSFAWGR